MREIKFRAWDKRNNKMYQVGVLGIFDNTSWQHGFNHIHNTQQWYGEDGCIVNPILMQYTGLKDKNGKEIYDGDILDYGNNRFYKVIFKDGCFCMENLEGMTFLLRLHEVIGNIYENPELLNN